MGGAKPALSAVVQPHVEDRVPGLAGHLRWRPHPRPRTGWRLGLSDLIAQHIADSRSKNALFPLADLIRRSVYRRLAGYEEMNDAERLSHDPAFRLIGSEADLGAWSRLHVPSALVRNAGHRQHRGPCLRRAGAERPTQQANGGARCCKTRQPQGWSGGGVRENWLPT